MPHILAAIALVNRIFAPARVEGGTTIRDEKVAFGSRSRDTLETNKIVDNMHGHNLDLYKITILFS
jgi:hypothetical protein